MMRKRHSAWHTASPTVRSRGSPLVSHRSRRVGTIAAAGAAASGDRCSRSGN